MCVFAYEKDWIAREKNMITVGFLKFKTKKFSYQLMNLLLMN